MRPISYGSITKSPDHRTQHIMEAYRTIELQRDLLKIYLYKMPLLTTQETESIQNEIDRMTLWLRDRSIDMERAELIGKFINSVKLDE